MRKEALYLGQEVVKDEDGGRIRSKKSIVVPIGQNQPQKKLPKIITRRSTPNAGSILRMTPFFMRIVTIPMKGSSRR
jgi:hypothetical protein